jgi:Superinfection immunity protein
MSPEALPASQTDFTSRRIGKKNGSRDSTARHRNRPVFLPVGYCCLTASPAIFALNLLLGWTFLGWVAALVWALTNSSVKTPYNPLTHDRYIEVMRDRITDNPYDPLSPEGQAWARGVADRERSR